MIRYVAKQPEYLPDTTNDHRTQQANIHSFMAGCSSRGREAHFTVLRLLEGDIAAHAQYYTARNMSDKTVTFLPTAKSAAVFVVHFLMKINNRDYTLHWRPSL